MSTDTTAQPGRSYILGPFLILLGAAAIVAGGMWYLTNRNDTMGEAAEDVGIAMENLDRARQGLDPLPMPDHGPNKAVLGAAVGGGAVLVLIGVLVLSSERRHRETLEAIERRDAAA